MKKLLRHTLSMLGLIAVLLFCVGATTEIADTQLILKSLFTAPNSIVMGVGFIAVGSLIKKRLFR